MRIIQLVAGMSGESGETGHQLYGLGDNGALTRVVVYPKDPTRHERS